MQIRASFTEKVAPGGYPRGASRRSPGRREEPGVPIEEELQDKLPERATKGKAPRGSK
jgi:hypothetical protein